MHRVLKGSVVRPGSGWALPPSHIGGDASPGERVTLLGDGLGANLAMADGGFRPRACQGEDSDRF